MMQCYMLPSIFHHQVILTTSLQQLTYFGVVFLLGPFMIATGAAMSPAIAAQFPKYQKIFRGRQTARSLHFLGLLAFILFIIVHLTMVIVERFPENMSNIVLGNGGKGTTLGVYFRPNN